ncbi:hypothetical protein D3I60_07160 [Brevibacterium permense]|uniref:IS3 family transposase n=1 Tax=Brevibacterium permense TaxID=234834 RepID=UPI0034E2B92E|nr:hypothetical protein [Brevibacterium permense]
MRQSSARARRDQALMVVIQDVYEANYSCHGQWLMGKAINRGYADQFGPVARCTVERLMRQLGIDGIRRRSKRPKTAAARADECPDDLVEREFAAPAPNCLWVVGIPRKREVLPPMFRRLLGGCIRRSSSMSSTERSSVGR